MIGEIVCPSCKDTKLEDMPEGEKFPLATNVIKGTPEGFEFNIRCPKCSWIGDYKQLESSGYLKNF